MLRSLYSGISGLRTHQVGLDVTANNIANVNTVAFKAGRATFKESMVQMLQGPSRPAGNQGGRNPMQIGLGVAIGSIDTMLRQGNFQTTGQITDLALEGRAYFAFSNGTGTFYSRNGGLQLDSEGFLVSPTNGWRLQGKMSDRNGEINPNTMIGDIKIPWADKAPARATDLVGLACNLNADSNALGSVTHTNRFLASVSALLDSSGNVDLESVAGRALLTDLFNSTGDSLGIKEGDVLKFGVANPNMPEFSFRVDKYPVEVLNADGEVIEIRMQTPTLQDFMDRLEGYLNAIQDSGIVDPDGSPVDNRAALDDYMSTYLNYLSAHREWVAGGSVGTAPSAPSGGVGISVSIDPRSGGISVNYPNPDPANPEVATPNPIVGLQVSSSRPGSTSYVSTTFQFPRSIGFDTYRAVAGPPPGFEATPSYTTLGIRIPATGDDELRTLFDANGRSLGFTNGDTVSINGNVGGRPREVQFTYYDGSDPLNPATTMNDLLEKLQEAFGLPPTDGTIYQRPSASIKASNDLSSSDIPLGAIVLRGQAEVAFALTGLSVLGKQADPNQPNNPVVFGTNMAFTEIQTARNTGTWTTSDIVYDESGAPHNFSMTFTHTGIPGEWLWEINLLGSDAAILGGNRGKISFHDGTPASFTFDDQSNMFRFDPRNGAAEVAIRLDIGEPGSTSGITQYNRDSTTAIRHQNGYPMGKLTEVTISENGEISGLYDNGISKVLAQIYVAEFNNPAGLMKMGDSMFAPSNNSGHAAMLQPGVGSTTTVKPGALEMSNVELETEFTNMITIQRGYQASARVISTSDQLLQELVQLVR